MAYDKGKLSLVSQPPGAGPRQWAYRDTGGESASGYQAAGFFTDANDLGVKVGDRVDIINEASTSLHVAKFTVVQDTGETQGTVDIIAHDTGGP